jgi:hypothetical protein
VKTEAACVMLALLSTSALSGLSGVAINSRPSLVEVTGAIPIAATIPSPDTPVGTIALDVWSGRSAPGATRSDTQTDTHLTRTLSTYLLFHKTWNESLSTPTTVGLNVCSE